MPLSKIYGEGLPEITHNSILDRTIPVIPNTCAGVSSGEFTGEALSMPPSRLEPRLRPFYPVQYPYFWEEDTVTKLPEYDFSMKLRANLVYPIPTSAGSLVLRTEYYTKHPDCQRQRIAFKYSFYRLNDPPHNLERMIIFQAHDAGSPAFAIMEGRQGWIEFRMKEDSGGNAGTLYFPIAEFTRNVWHEITVFITFGSAGSGANAGRVTVWYGNKLGRFHRRSGSVGNYTYSKNVVNQNGTDAYSTRPSLGTTPMTILEDGQPVTLFDFHGWTLTDASVLDELSLKWGVYSSDRGQTYCRPMSEVIDRLESGLYSHDEAVLKNHNNPSGDFYMPPDQRIIDMYTHMRFAYWGEGESDEDIWKLLNDGQSPLEAPDDFTWNEPNEAPIFSQLFDNNPSMGTGWYGVYQPNPSLRGGGLSEVIEVSTWSSLISYLSENDITPRNLLYTGPSIDFNSSVTFRGVENKTIVFLSQELARLCLNFEGCENIIWRNAHHKESRLSSGTTDYDLIRLARRTSDGKLTTGIWIDHCFIDCNHVFGLADMDGAIDLITGTDLCLISNCHIKEADKTHLISSNTSNPEWNEGRLRISFFRNFYENCVQRMALVRFGKPDFLNCYFLWNPEYNPPLNSSWDGFSPKTMQLGGQAAQAWVRYNFAEFGRTWIGEQSPPEIGQEDGGIRQIGNVVQNFRSSDGSLRDESIATDEIRPENVTWNPLTFENYEGEIIDENEVKAFVIEHAGTTLGLVLGYSLSVTSQTGGSVSATKNSEPLALPATLEEDEEVVLTATPNNENWAFAGWFEGSTQVSDLNPLVYEMPSRNVNLEARFNFVGTFQGDRFFARLPD